MKLRPFEAADAPLMLEWMHDPSVVKDLRANFMSKTVADCEAFIKMAKDTSQDLHLAIADENDVYQGSISLKHIDPAERCAEFAITIRSSAMGHGVSRDGMKMILEKGIREMGLKDIYWCVDPINKRAVRFYDKNGFRRVAKPNYNAISQNYSEEEAQKYLWYSYTAEDID